MNVNLMALVHSQNFITCPTVFFTLEKLDFHALLPTTLLPILSIASRKNGGTWQGPSPGWIFPASSGAPGSVRALVASDSPGLWEAVTLLCTFSSRPTR